VNSTQTRPIIVKQYWPVKAGHVEVGMAREQGALDFTTYIEVWALLWTGANECRSHTRWRW
jgi:hypothetical protein